MEHPIPVNNIPKSDPIWKVSNPDIVNKLSNKYFIPIYRSTKKNKKYMARNGNQKWIHFGDIRFEDFTKHQDEERRERFLKRNAKWSQSFPLTASWLSYNILW